MNDRDNEEPSAASAGSVAGKPMAWAVMQPDSYSVFLSKLLAEKRQELCMGGDIIPLYRHAQPTLTDAERKAVKWAAKQMQYINADNAAAILRGLLDRLG